jgi:hypothetical protein
MWVSAASSATVDLQMRREGRGGDYDDDDDDDDVMRI